MLPKGCLRRARVLAQDPQHRIPVQPRVPTAQAKAPWPQGPEEGRSPSGAASLSAPANHAGTAIKIRAHRWRYVKKKIK